MRVEAPDICIIGAGVAGALIADRLSGLGATVVMLEAGRRFDPTMRLDLMREHLEGRSPWRLVDPVRDVYSSTGDHYYYLSGKRLRAVGGSTHHWGGLAYRLHSSDFRLRTLYGIGEDWPITYDELEPYYARAEVELGVSGADGDPFAAPRSSPFPLPAFPYSYADRTVVQPACERVGVRIHAVPYARNSVPFDGRPACAAFGVCEVCPIEAMYNGEVHVRRAERSGRLDLRPSCTAVRLNLGPSRRVRSVTYIDPDGRAREQQASTFVVAAHAIESVRLLLLSRSDRHPGGLANSSGTLGRFFMEHFATGMAGTVDQPLYPLRIGFATAHTLQYYDTPERRHMGAIKLTFYSGGPTPAVLAAESDVWGVGLKRHIREVFGRSLAVAANVEQLPHEDNRIGLAPALRDRFGDPAPRIHLSVGRYERRTLRRARDLAVRILEAAGAHIGWDQYAKYLTNEHHPIAHHMGGCRMGDDPQRSIVDRNLRAHDVDNLFVVGSSVFPTGGAVNPTLTIAALALRAADQLAQQGS